jgi:hypothetical protein
MSATDHKSMQGTTISQESVMSMGSSVFTRRMQPKVSMESIGVDKNLTSAVDRIE